MFVLQANLYDQSLVCVIPHSLETALLSHRMRPCRIDSFFGPISLQCRPDLQKVGMACNRSKSRDSMNFLPFKIKPAAAHVLSSAQPADPAGGS
jgi:hypothetical protein